MDVNKRALSVAAALIFSLLSGCILKLPLVSVSSAENIRKTTDGRVFITGKNGLYEFQKDSANQFSVTPVYVDEKCSYFAGLTQLQDWMFFVCVNQSGFSAKTGRYENGGRLLAFSLLSSETVSVLDLHDYQFPNGLDTLPQENAVLIADEDFFGHGGLNKLTVTFDDAGVPVAGDYAHHWLGKAQGVNSVNGVRVVNDTLYVTDLGTVKSIHLDDTKNPELALSVYHAPTILDDLDATCDGLIVADFVQGRLIFIPYDGSTPTVSQAGLSTPSSVLAEANPFVEKGNFLVTESVGYGAKSGDDIVSVSLSSVGSKGCNP